MTALTRIQEHYAARNLDDMLSPLSPDIRWTACTGSPYAGRYVGADSVRENYFGSIRRDWSSFRAAEEAIIDGGDVVVGVGYYEGIASGSGKQFRARFTHLWHREGDTVVAFDEIYDTWELVRALTS